jgi:hypothetical protein
MEITYVIAVVLGICEIAKIAGLSTKYVPILGLIVGIICSYIVPEVSLISGVISALSAMGLYSGIKTTVK